MENILKKLGSARSEYLSAQAKADAARREETACLNKLNAAQKEFDEAAARLKKEAPSASDWKRRDRPPC